LQDTLTAKFERLDARDVLFINITHVSQIGSDVNWLFYGVFPRLRPEVCIHRHGVFRPFEHPPEWIEQSLLRALLHFNRTFVIRCFCTCLFARHRGWAQVEMPACLHLPGAAIAPEEVA
jgi:hypothetical protein